MENNEFSSNIAKEPTDMPALDVTGFAAVPDIVPLSEARGSRKAAIRVRLDALEEKGAESFADTTMQKLANSLAILSEAVVAIDPSLEGRGLESVADALEGFDVAEGSGRSNLGFWEKFRGQRAPLTKLLDRLEELVKSVPSFADAQEPRWKELATAYKRAHTLAQDLADSVSAGRVRIAKANADLKPAHEKTLKTLPENRGQETEAALLALRAARDNVERRIHALRGAHNRAGEVLNSVRLLASAKQELRKDRKYLDVRAMPRWEEAVAGLIQSASTDGATGTVTDLSPLRSANAKFARYIRQTLEKRAEFASAYRETRTVVSQPSPPGSD